MSTVVAALAYIFLFAFKPSATAVTPAAPHPGLKHEMNCILLFKKAMFTLHPDGSVTVPVVVCSLSSFFHHNIYIDLFIRLLLCLQTIMLIICSQEGSMSPGPPIHVGCLKVLRFSSI